MLKLPTVILEHTTRSGRHFDWLLSNPRDPSGRLWTARTMISPLHWSTAMRWMVQPIETHRRIYLDYQGPISGGRGRVIRIDRGWFVSVIWTNHRIVIDLHLAHCQGQVCIEQQSDSAWIASLSKPFTTDSDYLASDAGINLV